MRVFASILLCGLVLLNTGHALAGPVGDRVLHTFDFEERQLGNDEPTPMNWQKVTGPELPHYVIGQLAVDRHRSGRYSFRMDLDGGSCIYRFDPNRLPVQTGAHYRVEGFCQTTPLAYARARLTAYFVDQDLRQLPDTLRHSDPFTSGPDDADWHNLSVELTADDPQAAFLVLQLELLQPSLYSHTSLGERSLYLQDVHGSAWFDDVSVSQVPLVSISTQRAGNIFRRGDPLNLKVLLNDRSTDDLTGRLTVSDATGHEVYRQSGGLDIAAAELVGPNCRRVLLHLPDQPAGWYRASLTLLSGEAYVTQQTLDFIQLADADPPTLADKRFGVIATDLPFSGWGELPDLLPQLSVGRVKLAVWSDAGDVESMETGAFDTLLRKFGERGITPTACLISPPPDLAEKLGGKTWLQVLHGNPADWQGPLAYLIARHANHLDRWQIGADGTDAFVTDPQMRKVYRLVYDQFATLVQNPDVAMPWPAWYDLTGQLPATVALSVPPAVLPREIPLYTQDLQGHDGHNLSLSLQWLDPSAYGRAVRIQDTVQRIAYALSSDTKRIDLPLPFTAHTENGELVKQPSEMFIILRTLLGALSGSTFRGKLPVGDGIEAFLFDRDGQGIVVLWNRGNQKAVKTIALSLGEKPLQMDLWGNVSPLLQGSAVPGGATKAGDPEAAYGLVKLQVGEMPTILLGIDSNLAQLRTSVSFDQPLIESSFEPHTRHIRFTNSYESPISGMLRLRPPAGWTITPNTFTFNLSPGDTFDRELTVEFPYNSVAGPKRVNAEFAIQAERNVNVTVPVSLTLGLSDVGIQTLALRDGHDVVVQQMITNYGEAPINYTAFVIYPGQPRQDRLVSDLGPGKTTVRKFRLTRVDFTRSSKLRVGVKEIDGSRVLNDEVEIR